MKNWYRESLSFQLLRAARLHRACAARHLNDIGVHPGQETALLILSTNGEQPMTALAEALEVKPPTVTKMITRMTGQGLVKRTGSDTDRRSYLVSLTADGETKARELKRVWKRIEKEAMSGLNEKERRRFAKALNQLTEQLAAVDGS